MSSLFNIFNSIFSKPKSVDQDFSLYNPSTKQERIEREKTEAEAIINNTFQDILKKIDQTNPQKYIKFTNYEKSLNGTVYYRIPTDVFVRFVIWAQRHIEFDDYNDKLFENILQFIITSDMNRFFSNGLDFERTCTLDLERTQRKYNGKETVFLSSSFYNDKEEFEITNGIDKEFVKTFYLTLSKMFLECKIVFINLKINIYKYEDINGVRKRTKEDAHATVLLAVKNVEHNKIYFYWYDPHGYYEENKYYYIFFRNLANELNRNINSAVGVFEFIESRDKDDNNLQSLTSKHDVGMCQLFSLLWVHNVMMIIYNLQKQNNSHAHHIFTWIDKIDTILALSVAKKLNIEISEFEERKEEIYENVYKVLVNFFINVTNTIFEKKIGFYDYKTLLQKLTPEKFDEYINIENIYNSKTDEIIIEEFFKIFSDPEIKNINIIIKTLSYACKNLQECRTIAENFLHSVDDKRTFLKEYHKNAFKYFSMSEYFEEYLNIFIRKELVPPTEIRGYKKEIYKRYSNLHYPDEQNDQDIKAWKKLISLVSSSSKKITKKKISEIEKLSDSVSYIDESQIYDTEEGMIDDLQYKFEELTEIYNNLLNDLSVELRTEVQTYFVQKNGTELYNKIISNIRVLKNLKKLHKIVSKKTDTINKHLEDKTKYFIKEHLLSKSNNYNILDIIRENVEIKQNFVEKIQNLIIKNIMEASDKEAKTFQFKILNSNNYNENDLNVLVKNLKDSHNLPEELLQQIKKRNDPTWTSEQFNTIYIQNREMREESAKENARNIYNLAKTMVLLEFHNFYGIYDYTVEDYNKYYEIIKHIFVEISKKDMKKRLYENCNEDTDCFSNCCTQEMCNKIDKCNIRDQRKRRKIILSGIDKSNITEIKRR